MQRSYVQRVFQEIQHPVCPTCAAPMWLTLIEPYDRAQERRTFECQVCGNTKIEITDERQPSEF